jgi:hypothetical protein
MWWKSIFQRFSPPKIPLSPITEKNKTRIFKECFDLSLAPIRRTDLSFSLSVRTSSIPGSNKGVFLSGCAKKGTILALYPGIYYPPLPICAVGSADGSFSNSVSDVRHMGQTNEYIIHLNQSGGYLDGKDIEKHTTNPFAVAQMVNHPSPSFHPNVISFDFHWEDVYNLCSSSGRLDQKNLIQSYSEYLNILPNRFGSGPWYVDSSTDEVILINDGSGGGEAGPPCHLAGLAYMALEDIQDGVELFFDYKYPSHARPSWYHVPNFTPKLSDDLD